MREVKTQPVRVNLRSFLRHMRSQFCTKRLMQQMRCRMVLPVAAAPRVVHGQRHGITRCDTARFNHTQMHKQITNTFQGIGHTEQRTVCGFDQSRITRLTTRLAIERSLVDDDGTLFSSRQRGNCGTVAHQRQYQSLSHFRVVTQELRCPMLFAKIVPDGF